ncbi:MAG: hypothetical protein NC332_05640, partial [Firmicutes bacterium]|nr:hypothetical protein [Bacillota bacterium]
MQDGKCSVCGRLFDYVESCNSRYGYEYLSTLDDGEGLCSLYDEIDDVVSKAHDDASFNAQERSVDSVKYYTLSAVNYSKYDLTHNQAMSVISTFRNDNPLYYWISNTVLTMEERNGSFSVVICVNNEYANGNVRAEKNAELYEKINYYLSLTQHEENDYYVTLALHNALIDNIDYAYDDGGNAETASWAHNIVGVFDNESAVCEGYSKAFQLLLNANRIENVYVTGTSKGVGHAWNIVRLDTEWYWYDVTWDDQPNCIDGKIFDYFCKTDGEFLADHAVNVSEEGINYLYGVPTASNAAYNFDGVKIDETFTADGFTYRLNDYGKITFLGCQSAETVVIPEKVTYNGREYV